ncbi:hypothetical protein [Hoeflea sp.]|uniref:hypothetical protein n=1 Tax=Hoeflea sp. TaxID=1940281 RepID=UPI003A8EA9AE
MTKQKRDNEYLLKRLEREHPTIFADFQAGKFKSAHEALIVAGLKQPPKQLNVLKNAWSKANAAEQAEFRRWIRASSRAPSIIVTSTPVSVRPGAGSGSPAPTVPRSPKAARTNTKVVNGDGYLLPSAQARIEQIMKGRGLKIGDVMKDLGMNPRDASLGGALRPSNPTRISDTLAFELEQWIKDNKRFW